MRSAERSSAAFPARSEDRITIKSFHALEIWQFISILLSALVTGVFWGTWLGLSRSMASLTPETFLTIGHTMIANLGTVMAILMPAAILSILPVLFLLYRRRSWVLYPTLAGFALFIVGLAITLIVEVPIDNQIEGWTTASLPADWQQLRDRWELFHAIRSWVSVIGLALLIIGALRIGDSSASERLSVESATAKEQ